MNKINIKNDNLFHSVRSKNGSNKGTNKIFKPSDGKRPNKHICAVVDHIWYTSSLYSSCILHNGLAYKRLSGDLYRRI